MSNIPQELKYASSHEWVRSEGNGVYTVGITEHAQDLLGDMVFVELPDVGDTVAQGDDVAVAESVKAASDIYAPISGEIVAVNDALNDAFGRPYRGVPGGQVRSAGPEVSSRIRQSRPCNPATIRA